MFKMNQFVGQCLVAAALAASAMSAQAAPYSYHIDVNTSGLSGTGSLDMYLSSGAAGALPLTATLNNFSSTFGAVDDLFSGDYTVGADGSYMLSNGSGYNDLTRLLGLGGIVGFDVSFSGAFFDAAGPEGALFSVGLYNAQGDVVGDPTGVASVSFAASNPARVTLAGQAGFASVNAIADGTVPEPSALLLMLTGLGIAGLLARQRSVRR